MSKRRILKPWWLEDGTEICSVCHHLYLYETQYRCADCDAAVCVECIEVAETICLPCANESVLQIEIEV